MMSSPLQNAEGATPKTNADRHDRFRRMNLLEAEAGMTGLLEEEAIRLSSLLLDCQGKFSETPPEPRRDMRSHKVSGSSTLVEPCSCSATASFANS